MAVASSVSLPLSKPPLPAFHYTHKFFHHFSLHCNHAPTNSAVATQTPKVVLPTNQSSKRLLGIRHTDAPGGGLVFWHPKVAVMRRITEDAWKDIHIQCGYDLLYTPHVAKADLWKFSGHLDFYKENMFDQMEIEEELFQLRPMNCPYHILVYKNQLHSYRDFPIRVAELGTVYIYELSGSLHGLFHVRGFTQRKYCCNLFQQYEVNLSTRPEKPVGGDEIWDRATAALKDAQNDKGWNYEIDAGGGAFYGPKIDLKIEGALGRKRQCSTIQVDFNLPEWFDMICVDSDQERKRPIIIHGAVLGCNDSLEFL